LDRTDIRRGIPRRGDPATPLSRSSVINLLA
jgi:hypothetical protein